MNRRLARALLVIAALACLSGAAAFDPTDGTEAVLTDAAGQRLVGYGVVDGGLLVLRLGERVDRFVLLLLGAGGEVQMLQGIQGGGGTLLVDVPDGGRVPLASLLARSHVMLRVVREHAGSSATPSTGSGAGDDGPGSSPDDRPGSSPEDGPGDDGGDDGSGPSAGADGPGGGSAAPADDPGGTGASDDGTADGARGAPGGP